MTFTNESGFIIYANDYSDDKTVRTSRFAEMIEIVFVYLFRKQDENLTWRFILHNNSLIGIPYFSEKAVLDGIWEREKIFNIFKENLLNIDVDLLKTRIIGKRSLKHLQRSKREKNYFRFRKHQNIKKCGQRSTFNFNFLFKPTFFQ